MNFLIKSCLSESVIATGIQEFGFTIKANVRFAKGAVVAKGKTDKNGQIVIDGLFMGEYYSV